MMFAFNVLLSAVIISFCSWLAQKVPQLAGFIMALPLSTTIALAITQFQVGDTAKTFLLAKSIFVAVAVTLVFFVPFLLAEKFKIGFWPSFITAIIVTGATYPIHGFIMAKFFES